MIFYHISKKNLGPNPTFTPRIPETAVNEGNQPRICFAPTLWQCAQGVVGCDRLDAIIYELFDRTVAKQNPTVYFTKAKLFRPNQKLSDFAKTQEHWSLKPIKVQRQGYIDISKLVFNRELTLTNQPFHNFTNREIKILYTMGLFGNNRIPDCLQYIST